MDFVCSIRLSSSLRVARTISCLQPYCKLSPYPYKVYEKTKYVSRSLVYCHDPTSVYPNKAQILLYISFLCWTCYYVFLACRVSCYQTSKTGTKGKDGVNIFDNYYRGSHYQVICYLRKLRAVIMLMNLITLIEEQNFIENHVYVICKLQYIKIFDRSNFDELIIRTF